MDAELENAVQEVIDARRVEAVAFAHRTALWKAYNRARDELYDAVRDRTAADDWLLDLVEARAKADQ